LDKCVARIQKGQGTLTEAGKMVDGHLYLQSAVANNALESADDVGRKVDRDVLDRSRKYQNSNFDTKTNSALTSRSAGVMLYGLSSTNKGQRQRIKKSTGPVDKAKQEGKIKDNKVTEENLKAAGSSYTGCETVDDSLFDQQSVAGRRL
jgi:hypothetical protein